MVPNRAPMSKTRLVPSWQNAIIVLAGTVVSLVIVIGLHWGRPVLIPIALAILLTFLLNPIVMKLQRLGLGRMPAVMLGVGAAGLGILLIGGVVIRQVTILVTEIPQNTAIIKAKVKTLRQLGSGPLATQFEQMVEEISSDTSFSPDFKTSVKETGSAQTSASSDVISRPAPWRTNSSLWLGLTGYLSSAFEVLATLAFSLILLVVFLLGRDDLRDRVVVLAGRARVAVTSKALEDVTDRISRYLLMAAMLNGGFGMLLGLGLFALQVPYAFLWGFLAGSLRFIPYVGPWIGAASPIAIAMATSEGWLQPFAVFGFVLVVELVSNNILEPLVFGRSTGVSATALIISAAFWLYLWGPIGLVLSAPIAVCLMVLGKNIPQLSFLNLLLGSEPALRSNMGIYQRFMLGDDQEATRLLVQRLKDSPADTVFDEMLIPTLNFSRRDLLRGQLTNDDHQTILDGIQATLGHTETFLRTLARKKEIQREASGEKMKVVSPVTDQRVRMLLCPAVDRSDFVALDMLMQSLSLARWDIERTSAETLTSELVARIALDPPAILCIAALPPGGLAHARYLCKRLRERSPQLQILVGRWGGKRNSKLEREQLEDAGATFVTTSLAETCQLLMSRLPLLGRENSLVIEARNPDPLLAMTIP